MDLRGITHVKVPELAFEPFHTFADACLKEKKSAGYELLVVLVQHALRSTEYMTWKRKADTDVGIHTVSVVDMFEKKRKNMLKDQFLDIIVLKINLKLGGVNQKITSPVPFRALIDFTKTMVVGLDVTHPAPESEGPSIAGMVASVDEKWGQWPGTICSQKRENQEVVVSNETMTSLLKPHLEMWKDRHRAFPQQILVYRDGVPEGQYEQVVQAEYAGIKKACEGVYGFDQTQPRITIVIAAKRHHMRFYDERSKGNPEPGTVVDRGVTSQFLWEFYLQAHRPIVGTARPTHYVVVVDEIFCRLSSSSSSALLLQQQQQQQQQQFLLGEGRLKLNQSDVLYAVTQALSYHVGRATTATSVCAPAFWADKLCDRARLCQKKGEDGVLQPPERVHPSLAGSMFYV